MTQFSQQWQAEHKGLSNIELLIAMIKSTISPESWMSGKEIVIDGNNCLAITQSCEVNEQISEFISQLRRVRYSAIEFDVKLLSFDPRRLTMMNIDLVNTFDRKRLTLADFDQVPYFPQNCCIEQFALLDDQQVAQVIQATGETNMVDFASFEALFDDDVLVSQRLSDNRFLSMRTRVVCNEPHPRLSLTTFLSNIEQGRPSSPPHKHVQFDTVQMEIPVGKTILVTTKNKFNLTTKSNNHRRYLILITRKDYVPLVTEEELDKVGIDSSRL